MIVFTLAYVLVALCFVAPPREFVSAGLTVQNILSSYLGSEDMDFVGYHLKRTTSTVLLHSLLPLGEVHKYFCSLLLALNLLFSGGRDVMDIPTTIPQILHNYPSSHGG